jgi:hypothetical protein
MGLRDEERISREIDRYASKHMYDEDEHSNYPIVVIKSDNKEEKQDAKN